MTPNETIRAFFDYFFDKNTSRNGFFKRFIVREKLSGFFLPGFAVCITHPMFVCYDGFHSSKMFMVSVERK